MTSTTQAAYDAAYAELGHAAIALCHAQDYSHDDVTLAARAHYIRQSAVVRDLGEQLRAEYAADAERRRCRADYARCLAKANTFDRAADLAAWRAEPRAAEDQDAPPVIPGV